VPGAGSFVNVPEVLPSELSKVGRRRPVWLFQEDQLMRILPAAQLYVLEGGGEGVIFQEYWIPATEREILPPHSGPRPRPVYGADIEDGRRRRIGAELWQFPKP